MDAYVKVSGLMSATTGVGMNEYVAALRRDAIRRGKIRRGRRMSRLRPVERAMVPKRVVRAWVRAAWTMVRLVGAGTASRWKYHCETVAEVTDRWMPKIMAMVQRYMRMK